MVSPGLGPQFLRARARFYLAAKICCFFAAIYGGKYTAVWDKNVCRCLQHIGCICHRIKKSAAAIRQKMMLLYAAQWLSAATNSRINSAACDSRVMISILPLITCSAAHSSRIMISILPLITCFCSIQWQSFCLLHKFYSLILPLVSTANTPQKKTEFWQPGTGSPGLPSL